MSVDTAAIAGELEMAHVLFMDIVGYSAAPGIDAQRRLISDLQELVRSLPEVETAGRAGELLRLPTGDGMALVFFRDPLAPVRSAIELSRRLCERRDLPVRMGLHSGPVYRMADINRNENVAGGGINRAQRVMDCADAGHILLSEELAGFIRQIGDWPLEDLGEQSVKHGERIRLYNLHGLDYGNPSRPSRMQSPVAVRVVLLYKRNVEPDGGLLLDLEKSLQHRGFSVFADRHLEVGMRWAEEIDRRIREADVVIPLLSPAAVTSEMLAHELQIAREWAERLGRPRILPVRVDYEEPLPPELAACVADLEYALWKPGETPELVRRLIHAVEHPPRSEAALPLERLEPPGGAVPLDSQFYVERPADRELHAALARGDSIILIKGGRQIGKTSLLARGLQSARADGARVVRSDFQKLNGRHLVSPDALFSCLAESIADQLDLDVDIDDLWSDRRGPSENFERFWRRSALRAVEGRVVWGLDEVDRLFTCDFASEVFGLFRSWHNERALDPEGPWSRLTMAIAYATEAHLFITDVNQSPFNVGTRLALDDFTPAQISDLNARYGAPLREAGEVERLHALLGGQPYLTRRGLHEMALRGLEYAEFERQADRDEGIFGDHLRRILVLLARDPAMCDVVRGVLRGVPCHTAESFYRLRSGGLMTGDSARDGRIRCRIYATYLERHLL